MASAADIKLDPGAILEDFSQLGMLTVFLDNGPISLMDADSAQWEEIRASRGTNPNLKIARKAYKILEATNDVMQDIQRLERQTGRLKALIQFPFPKTFTN